MTLRGNVVVATAPGRRGIASTPSTRPHDYLTHRSMSAQVPLIDTSFGFTSAVEAAIPMIEAANTEAEACPNGIGIVKLMGRHSGFIALHATLASGDVDLCLSLIHI